MEICTLLGIKFGLVVLTKTDLVDEEWLELVKDDIQGFTDDTFLSESPVVPVSSTKGTGIEELKKQIDIIAKSIPPKNSTGLFRLPVDRVFTMKGFGTVITGTVASGKICVGDTISIFPMEVTSKVRGLQVHNQSVAETAPGMRTAINFQGLEKTAIRRGDVVSNTKGLKPGYLVDCSMLFLKSNKKALKNRARIRFHSGTSEIMGNLILLDREALEPGDTAIVQIRLESKVSCVKDDRFVVRSYSPVRTIGGGKILNPMPRKHKRFDPVILSGLQNCVDGELSDIIEFHVSQSGFEGIPADDLKLMTNIPDKQLNTAIQSLLAKKTIIQTDKESRLLVAKSTFDSLCDLVRTNLEKYHHDNPLKEGMSKGELKSKLPPVITLRFFNMLLAHLHSEKIIIPDGDIVRLEGHKIALKVDQAEIKNKIISAYEKTGLTPPTLKVISDDLKIDSTQARDVIQLLIGEQKIVKVKDDLYFHNAAIESLKTSVYDFFEQETEMTTVHFKDLTGGVSRKYLIPLLEYFDSLNFTIRVGDARQLRGKR
jgi:selenocysteine-specific elongation factor